MTVFCCLQVLFASIMWFYRCQTNKIHKPNSRLCLIAGMDLNYIFVASKADIWNETYLEGLNPGLHSADCFCASTQSAAPSKFRFFSLHTLIFFLLSFLFFLMFSSCVTSAHFSCFCFEAHWIKLINWALTVSDHFHSAQCGKMTDTLC